MTPAEVMHRPQPRKAFLVLFAIEIWERFGYYGMASLMVLYMVERLGMGDTRADLIWGAFSALVYSMPMLGGYVGDRILGARRTLVLGAMALGLGYVLLSVPLTSTFFPAMGLIALGNGLFKVNPNNLASRLYEGDRARLDILFTLYYTSLNIGSFVSILLTPWIKDHPSWFIQIGPLHFDSWHLAFGLSAIGLTLGLLNYAAFRHYLQPYGTAPDFKKLNWRKLGAVILVSLAIAFVLAEIIRYRAAALGIVSLLLLLTVVIFIRLLRSGDGGNRRRAVACIIFICISAVWAVYNQQIYTSLTLFALRNVRHEFLGVQVSAAQFQDLNQFWLVVLAGPLAWFYQRMNRSARGDFSMATKYAVGLYLLALAFFLYAASGFSARAGLVSPWWLVAGYAAQSLGELLISALGFSMVSQLVPERVRGIIMGAWFLGMGVSNYAGGAIAGLAHVPPGLSGAAATLPIYMRLFGGLALAALVCAFIVTAAIPLLKSLSAREAEPPAMPPAGSHQPV